MIDLLIYIDKGDDGDADDVSIKIYFYQKVGRVPGTTQPVSHQQMDEHIGPGGGVTELNFDDHALTGQNQLLLIRAVTNIKVKIHFV